MYRLATAATLLCVLASATGAPAATFQQVYAFAGGTDGQVPSGTLVPLGTQFIGTTNRGGEEDAGTIYTVTPGGKEQVIYSADSYGIDFPNGLLHVGNELYGTSNGGGMFGLGAVFVIEITNGTFGPPTIIHSFSDTFGGEVSDGAFPVGGLTLLNGRIYGTTTYGGSSTNCNPFGNITGCGTVFFVTPDYQYEVLYSFNGNGDGAVPASTLLPVGSLLFGTTSYGGGTTACGTGGGFTGCGTVFSITQQGEKNTLYAFQGGTADGEFPSGNLVKSGVVLYGTTTSGGSAVENCSPDSYTVGCGTIFAVSTEGEERVMHMFGKGDGAEPSGLTLLNGVLYGGTYSMNEVLSGDEPTLFSLAPGGKFSILHKFASGIGTYAALTASGNKLWGTTHNGGNAACTGGCGTVFKLTP